MQHEARREQEMLPPFSSGDGESRRAAAAGYGDFLELIDAAEAQGADDWLQWADREAVRRFPKDMELIARWMLHETIRGQTPVVRTLRTVLSTLPPEEQQKPTILDALARADFLLGFCDQGAERLALLARLAPGHDRSRIEADQLRGLISAKRVSDAITLARAWQGRGSPNLIRAICETFQAGSAYAELCTQVQALGGLKAGTEPQVAVMYLSALEAMGRLEDCLAEGQAYLDRVPADPTVAQLLRFVAIRLDRLDEITPTLVRSAEALAGAPEALELQALIALDADDYRQARALLERLPNPWAENACRLRLGLATTDPSASRRVARRAYRAYRRLGVTHAGPEMQYGSYLLNAARSASDLREALAVVTNGLPYAKGNPFFHRLYLSLLIANGRDAAARAHLAGLPEGLREARLLLEVALCFRQADGEHADVREVWVDHAREGGYRVFTARTTPAMLVQPVHAPQGLVVVFAVVFNGIDYVQPFLDHYRKLGVQGFVIVDNASTDGTRDRRWGRLGRMGWRESFG